MRRNIFTTEQIPKISGTSLNEIKAEDNIIDFGKNKYFKYVSVTDRSIVYTQIIRG